MPHTATPIVLSQAFTAAFTAIVVEPIRYILLAPLRIFQFFGTIAGAYLQPILNTSLGGGAYYLLSYMTMAIALSLVLLLTVPLFMDIILLSLRSVFPSERYEYNPFWHCKNLSAILNDEKSPTYRWNKKNRLSTPDNIHQIPATTTHSLIEEGAPVSQQPHTTTTLVVRENRTANTDLVTRPENTNINGLRITDS